MAITPDELLLEIGSEALSELTDKEIDAICQRYSNVRQAGMRAFELLMRKYRPSYRMGRMYVRESEKFEFYRREYERLASMLGAGAVGQEDQTFSSFYDGVLKDATSDQQSSSSSSGN